MNPFDREIFARTLWMEARGEPLDGIKAVAHVIWNRFKESPRYGQTVAAICLQDQQFSAWNAARSDSNREQMAVLDYEDPALLRCRGIVSALEGGEADPTDGANHYYSIFLQSTPAWVDAGEFKCIIGHHRFYKL